MKFILIVFALIAFAQAENEVSSPVSESANGIQQNEKGISSEGKISATSGVIESTSRSASQNLQNGGFSDAAYQNFNGGFNGGYNGGFSGGFNGGFNGQTYDPANIAAFKSFADYNNAGNGQSVQFSGFQSGGASSNSANSASNSANGGSNSANLGLRAGASQADDSIYFGNLGADSAQANSQDASSLKSVSSGKDSSVAGGDSVAQQANVGSSEQQAKNAINNADISGASFPFANSVFSTPATYESNFGFGGANSFDGGLRNVDSPFANFEKIITSNGPAEASVKSVKTGESSAPSDDSQQENKVSNNLSAIPSVSDEFLKSSLFRSEDINPAFGSLSNNDFLSSFSNGQAIGKEVSIGETKSNDAVKESNDQTESTKKDSATEIAPTNPTFASFAPTTVGNIDANLFGLNNFYPQLNTFRGLDASIFNTAAPISQSGSSLTGSAATADSAVKTGAVPTSIPSEAVTISTPEVTVPTPIGKTTVDTSIVKSGLPGLSQLSLSLAPQSTLIPSTLGFGNNLGFGGSNFGIGSTLGPFVSSGSLFDQYPSYNPIYTGLLPGSNPFGGSFGGSFGIGAPIQGVYPQFPSIPALPTPNPTIPSGPPNTVTISGDSVSVSVPNADSSVPTPIDKPVDQPEATTQASNEPVVEIVGSSMKAAKPAEESEKITTSKPSVEVTTPKGNIVISNEKLLADAAQFQSQLPLSFTSGLSSGLSGFSGSFPSFYNGGSYISSTPSYFNSNLGDLSLSQFGFDNGGSFGSDFGSISTSNIFKKKRQS